MFNKLVSIILTGLSCAYLGAMVVLTPSDGFLLASPGTIYAVTTIAILGGAVLAIVIAEVITINSPDTVTGAPTRRRQLR